MTHFAREFIESKKFQFIKNIERFLTFFIRQIFINSTENHDLVICVVLRIRIYILQCSYVYVYINICIIAILLCTPYVCNKKNKNEEKNEENALPEVTYKVYCIANNFPVNN